VLRFSEKYYAAQPQHFPWAANQHIRMISEVSCDTKNWKNGAENSALPLQKYIIFKYIKNRKQII